jgi:hypothetical protein
MKSTVGEVYNLNLPAKPADTLSGGSGAGIPIQSVDRSGDRTTQEMPLVDTSKGLNDQFNPYASSER